MPASPVKTRKKIYVTILLFLLVLTGFRVVWIMYHQIPVHPDAQKGMIDLRDWEFTDDQTITLDGEWEFYPGEFLTSAAGQPDTPQYITVPGNWKDELKSDHSIAAYGYGTYRLKVLLPLAENGMFGIRLNTVTAASELLINGVSAARQNTPQTTASQTATERGPYIALFNNQGNEAELLLHVSNFDVPFFGGVTDSVMIGSPDAILKASKKFNTLQLIVCIIYLLHSLYAFYIYYFGNVKAQKEVFYYGLLLVVSGLVLLIDDDIVVQLPIAIEWTNKLILFCFLSTLFITIVFIKHLFQVQSRAYNWLAGYFGFLLICMLIVPFEYYHYLIPVIAGFYLSGFIFLFRHTIKAVQTGFTDSIFILLFITSYTSNTLWGAAIKGDFSNIPYYPFDFMIAILAVALLLLNRHSRTVRLNKLQKMELQKADKLKDDFLANTSHELLNPLHGILNITHTILLDEKEPLSANNRESLQLLLNVGKQMAFTLNDLLDSTRLTDNHIQLNKTNVNIHSVASVSMEMMHFVVNGKQLTLQMEIPASFPEVEADENRLLQILFNLLHNAVKFTEEGTVSIRAVHNETEATIIIEDTGIGMNEDFQRHVFNRFTQESPSLTSAGGVGIGLTIVKQLVELHGGIIRVESIPDKGSVFSFTLPLAAKEETSSSPLNQVPMISPSVETAAAVSHLSFNGTKPRILVIDDDRVNLQILQNLLEKTYDISTAGSGKEALSLLESAVYDLLIIDVMMPHMSGYELTKIVRERFSMAELPILLLTARSQPQDIITGFVAGANDYISKPMNALVLQSRVQALTDLRQSVRDQNRLEAAWLQAQIQPHFLFNTLNTIASLAEIDSTRMVKLLDEFGNYLRHSFAVQNTHDDISLSNELELVRSYLYIEQERFGERLKVVWHIDEEENRIVPPLAIQTIVENAVRHGVLKKTEGGTVIIRTTGFETFYEVCIRDDGVGISGDRLPDILKDFPGNKRGIGLSNTDRRLRRLFGTGLTVESVPGEGTTVKFQIPF